MSGYKNLFYAWYRAVRNWAMPILCTSFILFPSLAGAFTATSLGDYGNVSVMQVSGNFDALNLDGTVNSVPRQVIAKEFLKTHKDEYDFVVIFSKFDYKMPEGDASAFYSGIKNDVRGIGQEVFDYSSEYGSNGKLQGTIDMGNLSGKTSDPMDPNFDVTLSTLAHEMLHRWGAWVKFKEADGILSTKLLGTDGSHWSYLLDTKGSVEYGNQWRDNGDGTFTSLTGKLYFSPLDLYLMGIIDKSQVPPMLLIDNPDIDPSSMPQTSATITGTARQISIDEIIAAEGERFPAARDSQKQFKMAFIFVTDDGNFSGDQLAGIESIRNGFLTRFSILTDGKALVQVASTPKDDLATNPGVRPVPTTPRTLPPNVNEGVNWLMSHQQADGSWVDFSLTTARDTSEVAVTLQRFPVAQQPLQGGLHWLANNASSSIDYLARRIETVAASGGDPSMLLQDLVGRRNLDGGWGSARDFESNPTDTALALKALARAGYGDQAVIGKAIAYLQRAQNSDGGWSGGDTISTIQPTAAVVTSFNAYRKSYSLEGSIGRAVTFLASKQNTDGGFGNSPSTVYDSALAVMALQEAGADKEIVNRGISYLTALQTEEGSWQESPYQTALAVRAVWQATVDPDLSITAEDITFIPEKVTSLPTAAVVSAVVWNLGRSDVPQAKVAIYDGAVVPDKKVGEQTVAFPGSSPVTVTFSVPVTDGNGHHFHVVVDPDNVVKEANENNNLAIKSLIPETTYDFELIAGDISVAPNPADVGQNLTLRMKVSNRGTSDAYNVPVRLFIEDPAAPLDIATVAVDIPAGGSVTKEITWKASRVGTDLPLTVHADPLHRFIENREDNNEAVVPVTIVPGPALPNLTVSYKDISITPNQVMERGNAMITATVKNEGNVTAENVRTNFYLGGANQGGVLLGSQVVAVIAAGQSVNAVLELQQIDYAGSRIISVQLDPENTIQETSKEDNYTFTTLRILSLPELAISANSVTLMPSAPKEGDALALAVTVQNKGEQDAYDVAVQVSEGGVVIGTGSIPVVKGNSQATVTVGYNSALSGSHELVITADPENKIPEHEKGNNTIAKTFSVQNSNLWVSEPYISPNGDGIKDSTQVFFRLGAPETVKVVVANKNGESLRTFTGGALEHTTGTTIVWDGKNDNGVVVADGSYTLQIVTIDNALLGSLSIVVDTNRSALTDAIGTSYLATNSLGADLFNYNSNWKWLPDESGIVMYGYSYAPSTQYSEGLYNMSSDGDVMRIVPSEWHYTNGSSRDYRYDTWELSPDGQKVSFILSGYNYVKNDWELSELWVVDADGSNLKLLASDRWMRSLVKWSNDSKSILYSINEELWQAKPDGSLKTKIADGIKSSSLATISMSPDDKYFSYFDGSYPTNRIIINDFNGNGREVFSGSNVGSHYWLKNNKMLVKTGISTQLELVDVDNPYNNINYGGHYQVSVSPNKDFFVYSAYGAEGDEVYFADVEGNVKLIDQIQGDYYYKDCYSYNNIQIGRDNTSISYNLETSCGWSDILVTHDINTGEKKQFVVAEYGRYSYQKAEPIRDGSILLYSVAQNQPLDPLKVSISLLDSKTGIFSKLNSDMSFPENGAGDVRYDEKMISPLENFLVFYRNGSSSDVWQTRSLLNLSLSLQVTKSASAIIIKGTAQDRNFAGYLLEYADIKTPVSWNLIAPSSDKPVVKGTFATWVPPHEGTFHVRLSVWDKAGNIAMSTKRVSWGISSSITSMYQSAEHFSPNGDGVKDTVEVRYRVLEPTHLEWRVYDSANSLMKVIYKDHAIPIEDYISWDGRDDSDRVVPDGAYKITVFDHEFPVQVDNSAPNCSAGLSQILYDNITYFNYADFSGLAYDANLKSWKIEMGEGDNPDKWLEFQSGSTNLSRQDEKGVLISPVEAVQVRRFFEQDIAWLKGKKFRITVEDHAGNLTSSVTDFIQEKVMITNWDDLRTSQTIPASLASPGIHVVKGVETTRLPVSRIDLQYWNGRQWVAAATSNDTSTGAIKLTWDSRSAGIGSDFAIRAQVMDVQGGTQYSNTLSSGALFTLSLSCSLQLTAKNFIFEELTLLKMQLMSNDDPNYQQWTDYKVYDAAKGDAIPVGSFVLPFPAFKPGFTYHVRMVGTAASGNAYTTGASYPPNCPVKIALNPSVEEAKGCGEIAPGIVNLSARPSESLGKVSFKTLSYFVAKPEGFQLLRSVDLIREGWKDFTLVTSGLPDADYPIKAVVSYLDEAEGKMKDAEATSYMRVDRVLPTSSLTNPAGTSLKVCPVKMTGAGNWFGIPVEGVAGDNTEVKSYQLFYGIGDNPSVWLPAMSSALQNGQLINRLIAGEGSLQGLVGVWNISGLRGGTYSIKLKVVDFAGNVSCSTAAFVFDNSVEIAAVTADKAMISPNGDGYLDDVSVSFQINEPATVDVRVANFLENGGVDATPLATVASGLQHIPGVESVLWEGRDFAGARIPDGRYAVTTSATDSCGNSTMKWTPVEVDATAPTVIISYPASSQQLPTSNIIEVRGTATDRHLQRYTLDVGEGDNPATWITVADGALPINAGILGSWNTFGREGKWTLRLSAVDQAGNKSSTNAAIDLVVRQSLVKSLEIAPKLFSPNSDGKMDQAKIGYELTDAAQLKLEISEASGAVAKSFLTSASSAGVYSYLWDGKNSAGLPVADGNYQLKLTAQLTSNPAVAQTETVTALVDTTLPLVDIKQPADKAYLDKTAVSITGTISDQNLLGYTVKVTGPATAAMEEAGNESRTDYTFGTLAELAEGAYAVFAEAKDQGENTARASRSFTIDRTPPKVTLNAPKTNENYGSSRNVVQISGAIQEDNLERYALGYGSGEAPLVWQEVVGGDVLPTAMPLWSWKVGKDDGVADGIYTISLYAKDKAGHEAEVKAKIIVDNTLPEVAITSPKDGGYVKGPIEIRGTAFDANMDHALLEISEGTCSDAFKWTTIKSFSTSIKDGIIETWKVLPPDGDYCLRTSSVDKAGSKAEVQATIKVDSHPPSAPALTATSDKTRAVLQWGQGELDLAGYHLYRNGQKLNNTLLTDSAYDDADLKEGSYGYYVKAVDQAGNESDASNTVTLKVDISGPSVRINSPLAAARVGRLVDIKGTAFSSDDFKEYRIFIGAGSNPTVWNLIRRSPLATSFGTLAQWETLSLQDGTYTVKLEGEDITGNVSTQVVTVTLDSTPPVAPLLLNATVSGNNTTVTWRANTETDLAGYLLYRNDQVANGNGTTTSSLKPLLLSGVTYSDNALPDGEYTYQLVAIDQADNMSDASNALTVMIELHPPRAIIVDPASGIKIDARTAIKAQCPDNDVKSVQFQYKKPQESAWTNLGAAVAYQPFIAYLDPIAQALPYGDYQVKAVATDHGGKIDSAPSYIAITYTDLTAPGAPADLRAATDGKNVSLSWANNGEPDFNGYNIYRTSGTARTKVNSVLVKALSYQDVDLNDGNYGYDITGIDTYENESEPSSVALARVFAPILMPSAQVVTQPTASITGGNATLNAAMEIFRETATGTSSAGKTVADDQGNFSLQDVPLLPGDNKITAKATDSAGNVSRTSEPVLVAYYEPPSAPTGFLASVQGTTVGLAWSPNPESNIAGYNIYRDGAKLNIATTQTSGQTLASFSANYYYPWKAFDGSSSSVWKTGNYDGALSSWWEVDFPAQELISRLDINWQLSYSGKDFQVQAWSENAWVTLKTVTGNAANVNSFDFSPSYRTNKIRILITDTNYYVAPLKQVGISEVKIIKQKLITQLWYQDVNQKRGIHAYKATAVDYRGLESLPSEELKTVVGDIVPPAAPSNVTATASASNINLNWVQNQETDLAGYKVYKETAQGWVILNAALLAKNSFNDSGAPNGSYRHRVTAVDLVGNESVPSMEATATLAVPLPSPPATLRADAVPEGAALSLSWEPSGVGSSYNLYRSDLSGGPYARINTVPIAGLFYLDRGLVNGASYHYVAAAVDQVGNESAFSYEASGVPVDSVIEKPALWSPAAPGVPGVVYGEPTDVAGSAEPGASVELFRDSHLIAKTVAYASDASQMTPVSYSGIGYSVSPDGAFLAYYDSSTYYLSIKNLSTGAVTPFAQYGSSPKWSPDGNKIASVYYSGGYRIGVFDRSTGTISSVTSDVNTSEQYPSWSADGIKVVFVSSRGGYQDVWMKDLVSGMLIQVTNGVNASYPQLSPDGKKLSYFQGLNLFVKDLGSGISTLLDGNCVPDDVGWSHNGRRVTYISSRAGYYHVLDSNLETGYQQQITTGTNVNLKPVWSPDDQNIAFIAREKDGSYSLKVTETAGGSRVLQGALSNVSSVAWRKTGALSCVSVNAVTTVYVKGFFAVADVELEPGENVFHAIATDDSGNVSDASEEISIIFDTSEMADISISSDDILIFPAYPKPGSEFVFTAVVRNPREIAVSNVDVELYLWDSYGDLKLLKSQTISQLGPNAEERISLRVNAGDREGAQTIIAVLDPANSIGELLESNNYATKEFKVTDKEEISVTTTLGAEQYSAGQDVGVEITLGNSGRERSGVLSVVVEDGEGGKVTTLYSDTAVISYGMHQVSYAWNTGSTLSGSYKLHAVFTGADGSVVESRTPFEILSNLLIISEAVTDKQWYGANEAVVVTVKLNNDGSNTMANQIKTRVRILDSHNAALFSDEKTVATLFPSTGTSLVFQWNTGLNLPDVYRAVVETYATDSPISSSEVPFAINPVSRLSGTVSVGPVQVLIGTSLKAAFTLSNSGNTGASGIVKAVIIDPASQAIVSASEQNSTLPINGSQTGEFNFPSLALELKPYLISLQYLSLGNLKNIASASFTVKDGSPPVVDIISPLAGAAYNSTVPIAALASDNASGVEKVEYQFAGGAWKPLPHADPARGRYAASWEPPAGINGPQTISFRAADRAGNMSTPVSVQFEIQMDSIPPVTTISVGAPTFEIDDKLYVSSSTVFTLNATDDYSGVAQTEYRIGTGQWLAYAPFALTVEGPTVIYYRSFDNATNAEQEKNLNVFLDATPPTTVITASDPLATGAVNTVSPNTIFTLTATDNLTGVKGIWYRIDDGQWLLFDQGFTLQGIKAGAHTISFSASDNLGNEEAERSLSVRLILAEVKKEISPDSVVLVGAWTDNQNKVKNEAAIAALKAMLSSLGLNFRVAEDGDDFKSFLRSGEFTTYLLVDYKDEKVGDELREAVNYGDSLIQIKTVPSIDPALDEVFGVKFSGKTTSADLPVTVIESPLSPAGSIQSHGKSVVGSIITDSASELGHVIDKNSQYPSVVLNAYGGGKAVLFTFDLLTIEDKEKAIDLLGNSIKLLTPGRHKVRALERVPVKISVANSKEPIELRLTETIPVGTGADIVAPEGTASDSALTWEHYLGDSGNAAFGYYLNLPDLKGEYATVTGVDYANSGEYRSYQTTELTLTVLSDSADLMREVATEMGNLSLTSSGDIAMLADAVSKLSQIALHPSDGKEAEKGVEALTMVAKLIRGLSADTADIRLKLDELLKIMERKWYLINVGE